MQRLLQELEANATSLKKEELNQLCDLVISRCRAHESKKGSDLNQWRRQNHQLLSDDVLGMVVDASFQLQRPDLLINAISLLNKQLPWWVYPEIGSHIHLLCFS